MRRGVISWALVLVAALMSHPHAQSENVQPTEELRLRFEKPEASNRLTEMLLGIAKKVKQNNSKLAVQVCSTRALSYALANAAVSPLGIYDFLVNAEGIDSKQIALMRSEECTRHLDTFSPVELRIIPPGTDFPPADESFM